MKYVLLIFTLLCSCMLCGAQAISLTVDNQTPGWLSSKINYGDQQTVENLSISGYLNPSDLKFIGSLMTNHSLKGMLDLSETQIVNSVGELTNQIETGDCFGIKYAMDSLTHLKMPLALTGVQPRCLSSIYIDTLTIGGYNMPVLSCENFGITNYHDDYYYNHRAVKHLVIREGTTEIASDFYNMTYAAISDNNLVNVSMPNTIRMIGKEAFKGTNYLPDTLNLPKALIVYNTTSFPKKNKQVIRIPESVVKIDNTYSSYNNMTNQRSIYDFIKSNDSYIWIMNSPIPPIVVCKDSKFLKGSKIYIPYGSKPLYASSIQADGSPNPFVFAELIEIINPVSSITLNYKNIELIEDESIQLEAFIEPQDASNKNVNWTSSDVSVAMVSPDGTVYAVKKGQATIMAKTADGGFVALCKVTVKAKTILAESLTLSIPSAKITVSENMQLTATVLPENVTNNTLRWSSTNNTVATVSDNGLVTGLSEGNAQVIVTTTDGSNLSAICNITVEKQFVNIASLSLNPTSLKMTIGENRTIFPTIIPIDATNQNLLWSSTNTSVAIISDNGVVTAISEGKAIIIATTHDGSNLSATCDIEVNKENVFVSSIAIVPNNIEGEEGECYQLVAEIFPEDSDNKELSWSCNSVDVASVDSNGFVTLKTRGVATITASSTDGSNVKAECTVIVLEKDGIDEIIIKKDSYVRIYTISGVLIYEGEYSQSNLASGTYIILVNDKVKKQIF